MAESEAEKKKIAELYFGYDTKNLNKLEQDIQDISTKASKLNEKLRLQINVDASSLSTLNTNLEKVLSKTENISDKTAEKIKYNAIKKEQEVSAKIKIEQEKRITNEQKTSNEILVNQQKEIEKRITNEKKLAEQTEEYNNRIAASSKTMYDKIAGMAETYLLYQGFNALKSGISDVITEMTELETQMVAIDRVLNDNSLNIDVYRGKLLDIASDYGNEMNNVTSVALRLAQAGYDQNEVLALTQKTMLALNTADLDAKQATDDMVAVMAQWGLMTGSASEQAEQYGSIIDKVNKVADNFPTTSADVMDALKKVSSAFNLAGASIDETIATIVAAEKASQRGGKAIGTALSNITQQLKDDKRLDIAESLGLNFFTDSTKTEFKDLMDIFQEMANKMQALKNAGKENSVEMQNLLSIFTVFRRNIGASLLGEMSDTAEGMSTYEEVLKSLSNAIGYSAEENTKYMRTTAAAQAQFNNELLKLKTDVWENGVEQVYRGILNSGKDVMGMISQLIKDIGVLPVAIGTVTAAFTMAKSRIKVQDIGNYISKIKEINTQIKATGKAISEDDNILKNTSNSFKKYVTSVETGKVSLKGYAASVVATTAKTIALTAANIALNAALSAGIGLAIGAITTAIDNWVHAEEKAIEKNNELKQQAEENANKYVQEANSLGELTTKYEKATETYERLKKSKKEAEEKGKDTSNIEEDMINNASELYNIQEEINKTLEGTGKQVNLIRQTTDEYGRKVDEVNESYKEQLNLVKSIQYEKKKESVEELKKAMEAAQSNLTKVSIKNATVGTVEEIQKIFNEMGNKGNWVKVLDEKDFEGQYKMLAEWKKHLEDAGETGSKTYEWLIEQLKNMGEEQKVLNEATQAYNDALGQLYFDTGAISSYSESLDRIAKTYSTLEGPNKLIDSLQGLNTQFINGEITATDYFNGLQEKIKDIDFSVLHNKISDGIKELDRLSEQTVNASENVKEESNKAVFGLAKNIEGAKEVTKDFTNTIKENAEETGEALKNLTEEEKQNLEAYQAIFAETTKMVSENLSNLMASYEDGQINFTEYSDALGEAAESTLDLYTQLNDLDLVDGKWQGASDSVNEYANSLQNAINGLTELQPLLNTIGDSYDYIVENSNVAGEAMFRVTQVGTEAYNQLATNVASSLSQMVQNDSEAARRIIDNAYKSSGYTTDAYDYSYESISNSLQNDSNLLNSVLNQSTAEAAAAAGNVSAGVGRILEELGKAIKNFDYNIDVEPSGSIKLDDAALVKLALGQPVSPSGKISFKISGQGGTGISGLAEALSSFGAGLANKGAYEFAYKPVKSSGRSGTSSPNRPTIDSSPIGSGGKSKKGSGGGSGSSHTPSSYVREEKEAEDTTYKDNLEMFKDYVAEKERLEKRWVDKQKDLGQLTNKDFLYITQQRIQRYQEYLAEVKKMTWLTDEDRIALEKEYTEKIEDFQVDYLDYLKDILNDEIKAIKDANKEKIQLIEDDAEARIKALKKLDKDTSRDRDEQDYQDERKEILDEISYWEQRTGREAQEALKKAKENLAELDEEWRRQLEDWSIDDQIEAIEAERDAEIEAIETSQEAQIKAMQEAYDARVKLYAETGKLIYDQSIIESSNLYNAYKSNFVNPIMSDLQNIQKQIAATTMKKAEQSVSQTPATTPEPKYETYTIKWGDTLSKIARNYGTTIDKIMNANPYVTDKNKIYAGKTLQIPKFHEGGIVGGTEEAFALLKPNEVILKPEWADSLNRMMKYFDGVTSGTPANITNGPSIQVSGDLVRIDANIKNKEDAEYLTKKIEKMLKDKFNIKK